MVWKIYKTENNGGQEVEAEILKIVPWSNPTSGSYTLACLRISQWAC